MPIKFNDIISGKVAIPVKTAKQPAKKTKAAPVKARDFTHLNAARATLADPMRPDVGDANKTQARKLAAAMLASAKKGVR